LFDETSTAELLKRLKPHLSDDGRILIQTLHPDHPVIAGQSDSGWRTENWQGMKRAYAQPYQWYFRNFADWNSLFRDCDLILQESRTVSHPETKEPISVIFILAPE
jgi:hypothetical protein